MERIEIKAPAKINIGLNIVSKRDDGFHNLETIFYQIHDLFDELTFEKSDKLELVVANANQDLVNDNIITKAVRLLEKKTGKSIAPKIILKKNIPIGAGLGGGSSDAASTLKAINELYELNLSIDELKLLALELGSDVPLFLYNYPTMGKSRGELLYRSQLIIKYPILLINPGIHISTKDAFASVIPKPNNYDYSKIQTHEINNWKEEIVNDFEASIFKLYPEIEEIKNKLYDNGVLYASMSGSGSTVYGIFESYEKAKTVAELFPKSYFVFIGNK